VDLYLIRHTQPQTEAGLCYGQLDLPLPPDGAAACAAVAARLSAIDALWTSPLVRCRALADAISVRMNLVPAIDERLGELSFGAWEGRHWAALERDETERWAADYWNIAPPGGESYRELHERVRAALTDIASCGARRIAIVTHAGPIRALLAHCLKLEPSHYPEIRIDYGGVALLREDGARWRLEYLNG
jgi:alpha-ribazole phosphatase